jgi:hypothetical protein
MLSLNFKNVHHVEIYLPCNFEVFDEKRARTPRWVIIFTSKLQGR